MSHYDVLKVKPGASAKAIKKGYLKLSRIHHPDMGGNAEHYKRINNAYSVLRDPESRARYDLSQLSNEQPKAREHSNRKPSDYTRPKPRSKPNPEDRLQYMRGFRSRPINPQAFAAKVRDIKRNPLVSKIKFYNPFKSVMAWAFIATGVALFAIYVHGQGGLTLIHATAIVGAATTVYLTRAGTLRYTSIFIAAQLILFPVAALLGGISPPVNPSAYFLIPIATIMISVPVTAMLRVNRLFIDENGDTHPRGANSSVSYTSGGMRYSPFNISPRLSEDYNALSPQLRCDLTVRTLVAASGMSPVPVIVIGDRYYPVITLSADYFAQNHVIHTPSVRTTISLIAMDSILSTHRILKSAEKVYKTKQVYPVIIVGGIVLNGPTVPYFREALNSYGHPDSSRIAVCEDLDGMEKVIVNNVNKGSHSKVSLTEAFRRTLGAKLSFSPEFIHL